MIIKDSQWTCIECGSKDILVSCLDGWPSYYIGGAPKRPEDADAYLCSSKCATKHFSKDY